MSMKAWLYPYRWTSETAPRVGANRSGSKRRKYSYTTKDIGEWTGRSENTVNADIRLKRLVMRDMMSVIRYLQKHGVVCPTCGRPAVKEEEGEEKCKTKK